MVCRRGCIRRTAWVPGSEVLLEKGSRSAKTRAKEPGTEETLAKQRDIDEETPAKEAGTGEATLVRASEPG